MTRKRRNSTDQGGSSAAARRLIRGSSGRAGLPGLVTPTNTATRAKGSQQTRGRPAGANKQARKAESAKKVREVAARGRQAVRQAEAFLAENTVTKLAGGRPAPS